jgi:hypothetical protein
LCVLLILQVLMFLLHSIGRKLADEKLQRT